MTGDLLPALLAAGMAPAVAQRIVSAVRMVAQDEQRSVFSAQAGTVVTESPGTSTAYALYASAPAAYDDEKKTFGRGAAALGVSGLAYVNGQVVVSGPVYSGGLTSSGPVAATSVSAQAVTTAKVAVLKAVDIDQQGARFMVPVTAEGMVVSKAGGQFSGVNTFDGPVVLADKVFWKGERNPSTIDIPFLFSAAGGSSLSVGTKTVAVLNDFGDGDEDSSIGFAVTGSSGAPSVQLQGTTVTVMTGATFDSDTCAIVAATTSIFHCTGVTVSGGPFVNASPWPTVSVSVT